MTNEPSSSLPLKSVTEYLDICTGPDVPLPPPPQKGVGVGGQGKVQSWDFMSRTTVRVILGQVLSIATYGSRTPRRGDSL